MEKIEIDHDALIAQGWRKNTGECPRDLRVDGKRIEVILRKGIKAKGTWAAWGRGQPIWRLEDWDYDILYFRESR